MSVSRPASTFDWTDSSSVILPTALQEFFSNSELIFFISRSVSTRQSIVVAMNLPPSLRLLEIWPKKLDAVRLMTQANNLKQGCGIY